MCSKFWSTFGVFCLKTPNLEQNSSFGVIKNSALVCIQNPGLQTFWGGMEHGLLSFSALFASVSWCLEILSTHMTKPTESNWTFPLKKLFFCSYRNSTHLTMHCNKCFPHMICHIDLVSSVMFVERISRHQKTHAKKALQLVSPCSIPSRNFWGPGFWILTKGYPKSPLCGPSLSRFHPRVGERAT